MFTKSWAKQLLNSSESPGISMIDVVVFIFRGLNAAIPSVFSGAFG